MLVGELASRGVAGAGGGGLMAFVVDCKQRRCSSVDDALVSMGGVLCKSLMFQTLISWIHHCSLQVFVDLPLCFAGFRGFTIVLCRF